jgi:hypothetical protein
MRDDDEIDNTCERLIRLAVSAMETSTTSVDRLQLAALEAAVVGLDPSTRAAIVEQLDSPGRFQRLGDWARLLPLIRSDPALAERDLNSRLLWCARARSKSSGVVSAPIARDRRKPTWPAQPERRPRDNDLGEHPRAALEGADARARRESERCEIGACVLVGDVHRQGKA